MRGWLLGVALALMATLAVDAAALDQRSMTVRAIFGCLVLLLGTLDIWEEKP
jgi:hypothetical protein